MFLFTDGARPSFCLCHGPEFLGPFLRPHFLLPVFLLRGSRFSLLSFQQGLSFLARRSLSVLYDPGFPLPVVVEGGDSLHLVLELVEGQGELLYFWVNKWPGWSVGPRIKICIGAFVAA